jgi:hypothetical protein
MRKLAFGQVGCLLASTVGHAQEEPLKNKKGHIILPEAGEFALGFNAIPVLTFIGNTFNGNTFNNSIGDDKFASGFGQNVIFGKYFLEDKKAIRVDFRFGVHSATFENNVINDAQNSPDSLVADEAKLVNQNYVIGVGHEWRMGTGRLQGVVGGGLFYGFNSSTKSKFEYGNDFSAGNAAPTSTTWDNFGNALGVSSMGERVVSVKGGNTWGLGARLFAGVEYFIAPKISLGAEFGWFLAYSKTGEATATFESWDGGSGDVVSREQSTSSSRRFDVDTDNFGGALYLMFHFK